MRKQKTTTQPSTRALRWMFGAFFAIFVGLGLTTTTSDDDRPPSLRSGGSGDHATLQIDANMTQQMSTPSAHTGRQNHTRDPQLSRSRDPGYLAQLEQHQRDVDRMLARSGP